MKKMWSNLAFKQYTIVEWRIAKTLFILFWAKITFGILHTYSSIPVPSGIFTLFHPSNETLTWLNPIIVVVSALHGICYLFEYKMRYTTLMLFILSVYTFSLQESNGILTRSGLVSFIFFAQFLAYALNQINKPVNDYLKQFNFSVQAIVATYALSAISKLTESGIAWINGGKYMALQIIKSYEYKYVTTGNYNFVTTGNNMALFVQTYPKLISAMLAATLALELCAVLFIQNKRNVFIYGILLLTMHIAMGIIMRINLTSISAPMVIFMVVPGLITLFYKKLANLDVWH